MENQNVKLTDTMLLRGSFAWLWSTVPNCALVTVVFGAFHWTTLVALTNSARSCTVVLPLGRRGVPL